MAISVSSFSSGSPSKRENRAPGMNILPLQHAAFVVLIQQNDALCLLAIIGKSFDFHLCVFFLSRRASVTACRTASPGTQSHIGNSHAAQRGKSVCASNID